MPIFEYLCTACNRIYSFLSLTPAPGREPVCPRCGASGLQRVPSAFAVRAPHKAAREAVPAPDAGGESPSGMEAEAARLLEGLGENEAEDPRVMARVMRRLAETSGERMTPTMEEMFRRMEAGEDPEALEEELGGQLEAEMEEGEEAGSGPPTRDEGLYGL